MRQGIENVMGRNYASPQQVSGWGLLFDRRSVAGPHTVRLVHDRFMRSAVMAALSIRCSMRAVFTAAGRLGGSRVRADRAGGGLHDVAEGY